MKHVYLITAAVVGSIVIVCMMVCVGNNAKKISDLQIYNKDSKNLNCDSEDGRIYTVGGEYFIYSDYKLDKKNTVSQTLSQTVSQGDFDLLLKHLGLEIVNNPANRSVNKKENK